MALLPTAEYRQPILQALLGRPEGLTGEALVEEAANIAGVATDERLATSSDGTPRYAARIRYARSFLRKNGYVARVPGRRWVITKAGEAQMEKAGALWQVRADDAELKETGAAAQEQAAEAPVERVDPALREIQEDVEDEVLSRLRNCPPDFFERTVLSLLAKMGYGEPEHTGGPGDGGIDGVLRADRLGLERVYVQAKRRREDVTVGSDEIQGFVGALAGRKAHKGVFITTSKFSPQAQAGAEQAGFPLALVDGRLLASLMVEHGIGVSRRHVRVIPEIDPDFFEDD
jgi:restriction system protein